MSETREDLVQQGVELAQHLPEGTIHRAMADEILRLRDEARGVRAVEKWLQQDAYRRVARGYDGNVTAYVRTPLTFMSKEAEEKNLAALGLELLKQGRVTL